MTNISIIDFLRKIGMALLIIITTLIVLTGAMYFFQVKMIFFPESLPQDFSYAFDAPFEEVNFAVDAGVEINALHFKADAPKGVVFYSHGNAGSLRGWGSVAEIFLAYDYDVLIYDYRSYGKSSGQISEEALYRDAEILYSALLEYYAEDQIIVYGRSIGTGVALQVAANHQPKQLILESPYYNLPDLVQHILPFVPKFIVQFKFMNNEKIGNVECPITIFHGTSDEVIYFGSSLKLEKFFKNGDQLIPIPGGHHNDLSNFTLFHKEMENILR